MVDHRGGNGKPSSRGRNDHTVDRRIHTQDVQDTEAGTKSRHLRQSQWLYGQLGTDVCCLARTSVSDTWVFWQPTSFEYKIFQSNCARPSADPKSIFRRCLKIDQRSTPKIQFHNGPKCWPISCTCLAPGIKKTFLIMFSINYARAHCWRLLTKPSQQKKNNKKRKSFSR